MPTSRPEGCRRPVLEDTAQEPQPQNELDAIWDAVQREPRSEVTEVTFHIWLQPLEPAALLGGTLFVRAPVHIRTWVEERFRPLISSAARKAGSALRGVEVVDMDWDAPVPTTSATAAS